MQTYKLGPNGAILTSLNLFATNFGAVIDFISEKCSVSTGGFRPIVLIDTPGQIESFTWSASGQIICECLASAFPTIIAYVTDIPRSSSNPMTFMTNMLYSCSIMFRMQLPILLVLNKNDIEHHAKIESWIKGEDNFQNFEEALKKHQESSKGRFVDSLALSLAFALVEFYDQLSVCWFCSASTTDNTSFGYEELMEAFDKQREAFINDYWPKIEAKRQKNTSMEKSRLNVTKNVQTDEPSEPTNLCRLDGFLGGRENVLANSNISHSKKVQEERRRRQRS
ncbi:hypothetical protein ACOME3_006179 [Neoechinorhynchus agilis]